MENIIIYISDLRVNPDSVSGSNSGFYQHLMSSGFEK